MKTKLQIKSVRVEQVIDESPDLSWLGEYKDSYSGIRGEWAIVRQGQHAGEFVNDLCELDESEWLPDKNREYRFFLPPVFNYTDCNEEEIRHNCKPSNNHKSTSREAFP